MPRQNGLSCATSSAKPFLPIPTNPSPLSFGGNFRRSFSTAWWALLFLGFTQEILSASASEAPSLNFTKPKRSGAVSLAGCCASQNRTKAPAGAPSCNLFEKATKLWCARSRINSAQPCSLLHVSPESFAKMTARSKFRSEEHTSELQSHSDLVCRL